jgi:uncharacterized membrane protein
MRKFDIKFIASSAIIAALYVALTWLLAPISYGSIQFRISEILVLLVFFNPKYALAIILGTFISNTTSSLGWYDMVFGTLATTLSVFVITKCKNVYQAALAPVVFNGVIVALELYIALKIDIWLSLLFVSIGEAVVLFLIGIPVMNSVMNNEALLEGLNLEYKEIKGYSKVNIINSVVIGLTTVLVIFFFACPIMTDPFSAVFYNPQVTVLSLAKENKFIFVNVVLPILYLAIFLLLKGKLKTILTLIIAVTLIAVIVWLPINYSLHRVSIYYYIYLISAIILISLPLVNGKLIKDEKSC